MTTHTSTAESLAVARQRIAAAGTPVRHYIQRRESSVPRRRLCPEGRYLDHLHPVVQEAVIDLRAQHGRDLPYTTIADALGFQCDHWAYMALHSAEGELGAKADAAKLRTGART
jgi:hypothetical protein